MTDPNTPLDPSPNTRIWTVIGFWDGDEPVPVGVIEGQHDVTGGDGCTEHGPWATSVAAPHAEHAEAMAITEMRGD